MTVEALMYSLRSRALSSLSEANTQRRLADLDAEQLAGVVTRLSNMRELYPAVTDELLSALGTL
jgi:ABC-type transporter Mla maintaining outer membrane lipid asymmetry permease subunit MlaE